MQPDIQALEAQYGPLSAPKPKIGGLRGAALNFLPLATGAAGAVIGTAAAPVVGTAVGGAVGSGLGEYLRQKITGEQANLGSIGRETVFGAIPGGLGMAGRAVNKARGAKGAIQATEESTEAAMQARKGMVDRTKDAARTANQEGMGLTVGQSAGRGKVLTPADADRQYDFMTNRAQQYGGIRPGKPIEQAKDAQNVFNNVTKSLDETLNKINRPLAPQEAASITASAATKVADNPAITGTTKTLEKFNQKIQAANGDLAKLEKIRREADDLAFTSTGAGKTSAAAQAHAVRDAIDEFITPLSPDYKAIKGDYTIARDVLESTSKANKSAKGFTVPFTGTEVGKQTISGIKNKVTAKVSGSGSPPPGNAPAGYRPFMGQAAREVIPQAATRAAGSVLFGTPFVGSGKTEEPATSMTPEAPMAPELPDMEQPANNSIFGDPSKVEQAYAQAIMAGDTQAAAAILKGYELFGGGKSKGKPMSAEASKVVATANSGLGSLAQLESMIADGGVPKGTTIPGRGLFGGAGQALLGTSDFDAAADNVADAMVRARTGAAATKEELALYRRLLPQAFDPPEVQAQKMQTVRDYFTSIANRTGAPGTDLEAMMGTQ